MQTMSDHYSVQEVGGAELAEHFPDRGVIPDSKYHRAVLTAAIQASGWRRLFAKSERFIAVLSANRDGLRVLVSLDNFATFIPWSEMAVSAERSESGTIVRLQLAAVSAVNLELHLNDTAADAVFSGIIPPLPRRDPPGRLYWPRPWAVGALVAVMLAVAGVLALLQLSWITHVVAVVIVAVVLSFLLALGRPLLEEDR
jgi:hypothetical protein